MDSFSKVVFKTKEKGLSCMGSYGGFAKPNEGKQLVDRVPGDN